MALHDLGDLEGSAAAIAELLAWAPEEEHPWPYGLARLYAWLGDNDNAFKWLERTREREPIRLLSIEGHYFFSRIHDDPRWQPFIERVYEDRPEVEFNPKLPPDILAAR